MTRKTRILAYLLASLILGANGVQANCAGDCNSDGGVAISELVRGVNIALEKKALEECPSFDSDLNGKVSVSELIRAVRAALDGCPAGTIDDVVRLISSGDIRTANQQLLALVAASPGDLQARLYLAVTRFVVGIVDNPVLRDLAARSGVEIVGDSSDICEFEIADHPRTGDDVPKGAPNSGEILAALRTEMLPLLEEVLETLRSVPQGTDVILELARLPGCINLGVEGQSEIEIDDGDFLLARGALEGAVGGLGLLRAYDLDAPLAPLVDRAFAGVVDSDPGLLTLRDASLLGPSRMRFDAGLSAAVDGIDSILAETDDQDDDFLVIAMEDLDDLDRLRESLTLLRSSLTGLVTFPERLRLGFGENQRLDLSILFGGGLTSLRGFPPRHPATNEIRFSYQFPDPTFGNVAADLTAADICAQLERVEIYCFDAFEDDNQIDAPSQITCGESQMRSTTPENDVDWVRFTIEGSQRIRASIDADAFAYLDIYRADGSLLAGDLGESPSFDLPIEAGSYVLRVEADGRMLYQLRVDCLTAPTPTANATLSPSSTVDAPPTTTTTSAPAATSPDSLDPTGT